jgi:DNA polymerase IV
MADLSDEHGSLSTESKVHPSLLVRKIIHVDMDAFYASVEMRDDPSLRDKPVVVGGDPNSRGVVATCNYPARKYGIHSAMASSRAYRLCPQAVFIRPNFEKYREASQKIRAIFHRFTDLVEPLSLDEAYLDVTNNPQGLYAVQIAKQIRAAILDETSLTASAGVAPNKMVAKIASDYRKPNGLTVVLPHQVEGFMANLPLRKISGVGAVTEQHLKDVGLFVCKDVWTMSPRTAEALGDRMSEWLAKRARGIDERPVETEHVRKSVGQEETFASDILDPAVLRSELTVIAAGLAEYLEKKKIRGRTLTLKVKYSNFKQITRSLTLENGINDAESIVQTGNFLLQRTEAGTTPIRLLGLQLSNLC